LANGTDAVLFVREITSLDSVNGQSLSKTNSGIAIAPGQCQEEITMLNEDRSNTPELHNNSTEAQKTVHERLNRIANKAAEQAEDTEQRYDEEHGIFTK
jgi:hypothetical protein